MAKVYVGNLSWNTTDDGLAQAFSPYGQLTDYIVMKDRDSGRSRGFGFVTYMTQQEADAAIMALNETELDGRRIRVNMANSRPPMGGMMGANLGYRGLTGGYGAGADGAAQGAYAAYRMYISLTLLTFSESASWLCLCPAAWLPGFPAAAVWCSGGSLPCAAGLCRTTGCIPVCTTLDTD